MSRFIVAPRRRKNNLKVKQEKEANFIHRFIDYKKKAKQNDRFPRVLVEVRYINISMFCFLVEVFFMCNYKTLSCCAAC